MDPDEIATLLKESSYRAQRGDFFVTALRPCSLSDVGDSSDGGHELRSRQFFFRRI